LAAIGNEVLIWTTLTTLFNFERIVVLAPHTDDGEFACGGSIAQWTSRGIDVHYIAFSDCQQAVPDGWPADVLINEVRTATRVLGVKPDNLRVLDFEVRRFATMRQEILQTMVDLDAELEPDLVLLPSVDDLHQDHHTVAVEGLRAFKRRSMLAYEVPWNNIQFRTECFVALDEDHVLKKLEAIKAYASQQHRLYSKPDFLRSQLVFRGTQIGVDYAEAFDVVRWVMR
jgi:LmbE family N-acetylglucosaminyl deacetylase